LPKATSNTLINGVEQNGCHGSGDGASCKREHRMRLQRFAAVRGHRIVSDKGHCEVEAEHPPRRVGDRAWVGSEYLVNAP